MQRAPRAPSGSGSWPTIAAGDSGRAACSWLAESPLRPISGLSPAPPARRIALAEQASAVTLTSLRSDVPFLRSARTGCCGGASHTVRDFAARRAGGLRPDRRLVITQSPHHDPQGETTDRCARTEQSRNALPARARGSPHARGRAVAPDGRQRPDQALGHGTRSSPSAGGHTLYKTIKRRDQGGLIAARQTERDDLSD
jgi:hypothetical protein